MFYRLSPKLVMRSRWRLHRPRTGERVLVLAGGSVFPPGHPTTRLCLDLLTETLTAAPCARLLDVGCGSGVLLLAGIAAGAELGVGVDLSGPAVAATRNNARVNGLAAQVKVVQGSTEALRGPFDLMVGNLPWAVQMEKVAEFTRLAGAQHPLDPVRLQGHPGRRPPGQVSAARVGFWQQRCTQDESVAALPPDWSFTWVAWRLVRGAEPRD